MIFFLYLLSFARFFLKALLTRMRMKAAVPKLTEGIFPLEGEAGASSPSLSMAPRKGSSRSRRKR